MSASTREHQGSRGVPAQGRRQTAGPSGRQADSLEAHVCRGVRSVIATKPAGPLLR